MIYNFPQKSVSIPAIYAYKILGAVNRSGLLKVGFTTREPEKRVQEQVGTSGLKYEIVLVQPAMRNDGTDFSDHDVHNQLKKDGFENTDGEWFKCKVMDIQSAIIAVRDRVSTNRKRILDFKMRPEQEAAVLKTMGYFENYKTNEANKKPHFLWNAKMRFGKTFAAYQLALKMRWTKVLVLTYKPAVQAAWEEDLNFHKDFDGWQFISNNGLNYNDIDNSKPFVCFGSFQDHLGKNKSTGGIKIKNKWVHLTNWDCVIFDEYHYGAWNDNSKDLTIENEEMTMQMGDIKEFDEEISPINTDHYLYLSGTPFRAIESGEFIEEQIFNWTYSDEQKAKEEWKADNSPYASLPRIVLLTYKMPDDIREVALTTEFNEFDLNLFFKAEGKGQSAKFKYKEEVQKWLDLIRGSHLPTTTDNLKLGAKKPPMPFSDIRLLGLLNHTFWFLPTVASCHAMKNLILERQNNFYHQYKTIVAAGNDAGVGVDALVPVLQAMSDPMRTKTITLSCGKLTTGVSVKPWTGILMLRNSSSPETYFQAAFRVQTPWTVKNPTGIRPNEVEIIKKECYIFDFAPNRALSQISDYSCRLNISESDPEEKVGEFINFLPVLAYDGSSMSLIDAKGVLDMAMSGTTATLLARRWKSRLLVNADNATLLRIMASPEALKALENIEGFRNINEDLKTIINKSDEVKKARKEKDEFNQKEKIKLTEAEKEYISLRKKIQDKLLQISTRVPIFMYLTDFREKSLTDVITHLEPGLFKKVTALSLNDFDLLISLGVFNRQLMNDAVYKFKRYEDASLEYIGINKHAGEDIGLFDTTITAKEYNEEI